MPRMAVPRTRLLHDQLLTSLAAAPGRPVLRTMPGDRRLDLDAFLRRVAGAERRLIRMFDTRGAAGVPEGGIILLSARNLDSYLVAIATLWKFGLVPLLADADLSRSEIAGLVRIFRPAACLLDRAADLPGGRDEHPGEALAGLHAWVPKRPRARTRADGPAGAAIVRLTSGTTGRPRGLMVTADQLLADAQNICTTMGITPEDTMVAAIPMGHAYGFVHVLMSLVLQGTRPLLLEHPLPALLRAALSQPGPLVFPGTPYLHELLLQGAPEDAFRGLRLAFSAGAPLPEHLSRAFKERFGLPIRTFYGASECGGISYDRSDPGILPDGCVGMPLEGVGVTLRPEPGAAEGQGRICVRSSAVVAGIYPDDDGGDLQPGLFMSSDLGRIDEHGALHLTGRLDRMVNVAGRKVNPHEVERALLAIPGVRQAVVFGAPDRHRGQALCACIVATKGVTRETLLRGCRERLASFKIPRRIEFVPAIPLTTRGKTDRRALARLAGSGTTGDAGARTASRPESG